MLAYQPSTGKWNRGIVGENQSDDACKLCWEAVQSKLHPVFPNLSHETLDSHIASVNHWFSSAESSSSRAASVKSSSHAASDLSFYWKSALTTIFQTLKIEKVKTHRYFPVSSEQRFSAVLVSHPHPSNSNDNDSNSVASLPVMYGDTIFHFLANHPDITSETFFSMSKKDSKGPEDENDSANKMAFELFQYFVKWITHTLNYMDTLISPPNYNTSLIDAFTPGVDPFCYQTFVMQDFLGIISPSPLRSIILSEVNKLNQATKGPNIVPESATTSTTPNVLVGEELEQASIPFSVQALVKIYIKTVIFPLFEPSATVDETPGVDQNKKQNRRDNNLIFKQPTVLEWNLLSAFLGKNIQLWTQDETQSSHIRPCLISQVPKNEKEKPLYDRCMDIVWSNDAHSCIDVLVMKHSETNQFRYWHNWPRVLGVRDFV